MALLRLLFHICSVLHLGYSMQCGECECDSIDKNGVQAWDVDCSEKDLQSLPPLNVLQGMTIHRLTFEDNSITSLPARGFGGLVFQSAIPHSDPNIEISSNPLQAMADDAFIGVRADVIGLRMTDCRMEDFPARALGHLTNLTFLFIGNNRFTRIPTGSFENFKKLRLISIPGNQLSALDTNVFAGLENVLAKVIIDNTNLEKFPSKALETLTKLELLKASKNRITALESGAFSNFKTKENLEVYLVDNEIADISPDAFKGAKIKVKKLQLDGNSVTDIKFLDNTVCTNIFTSTSHVYLMDSPLNCDCDTYAILSSERLVVDGTCASPKEVKDLDIRPDYIEKAKTELCKNVKPKCSIAAYNNINIPVLLTLAFIPVFNRV